MYLLFKIIYQRKFDVLNITKTLFYMKAFYIVRTNNCLSNFWSYIFKSRFLDFLILPKQSWRLYIEVWLESSVGTGQLLTAIQPYFKAKLF